MNEITTIQQALVHIQSTLKAPKGQYNKFAKFNYRSCEDILTAVKPILVEVGGAIVISDEPTLVGDRYYIKATVILTTEHGSVTSSGYAREPLEKKGMDASQITGTASSYARKYALNGLLAIDDSKDSDVPTDKEPVPLVSDAQVLDLEVLIHENDLDTARLKKWMKSSVKVEHFADLNANGYKTVLDMVNRKIEAISHESD